MQQPVSLPRPGHGTTCYQTGIAQQLVRPQLVPDHSRHTSSIPGYVSAHIYAQVLTIVLTNEYANPPLR